MDLTPAQKALGEYYHHTWDATTRLCACGDWFEATLDGNRLHDEHRMFQALKAASNQESRTSFATALRGTPIERFTEQEMNRMAQWFYDSASRSGEVTFNSMTCKPVIVKAIRTALDHVGSLQ